MQFESPRAFLILLLLPPLLWLRNRQKTPGAIGFSSITHAVQAGRSLRQRFAFMPLGARMLALALLIACVARPQKGLEQVREKKEGIAIEMVVDRSASMMAEMDFQGERLNRLAVVKRVFQQFALGNGRELKGRPDDLIGIVAFAAYADTVCPLTLAHETFPDFLETIQFEGGTAIGDAIALAAARLKTDDESPARQARQSGSHFTIKSKVMILLTDGQNNAGKRDPVHAAQLAAQWGIKIYAVGIGGRSAVAMGQTPFRNPPSLPFVESVDEGSLKAIAESTGGIFRMAEDGESLKSIYQEIDRLERSAVQVTRFANYRELFPPLALAALLLVSAETVLNCTLFRRIP